MPTYGARCPQCKKEVEYIAKMADREKDIPFCDECKDETGQSLQMESAFIGNPDGGFVLKGRGWFNKGGY